MLKLVALLVLLAVASSEAKQFDLVDLGIHTEEGKCTTSCNDNARKTETFFKTFGKQNLQLVQLQQALPSCDCTVHGVENFDLDFECTKTTKVVDYVFKWMLSRLEATCTCQLPNNPAEVAEILNKQDRPAATCGMPPYSVNTVKYEEFTCSESGEGKSNITMKLVMDNTLIDGTARANFESQQFYPLQAKGAVDSASLTYDGNPDFQDSFQCLQNNLDPITQRFVTSFLGWFWPCTFGQGNQFIHQKIVDMLNCD